MKLFCLLNVLENFIICRIYYICTKQMINFIVDSNETIYDNVIYLVDFFFILFAVVTGRNSTISITNSAEKPFSNVLIWLSSICYRRYIDHNNMIDRYCMQVTIKIAYFCRCTVSVKHVSHILMMNRFSWMLICASKQKMKGGIIRHGNVIFMIGNFGARPFILSNMLHKLFG